MTPGLPSFAVPDISLFKHLWPAAVGIALMSFVETIAAGKAFHRTDEPPPSPNRELLAIGLSNLVGGFFHNLPSGGGTSQTAVNSRAGARTQIAGLSTAAVVVAVLCLLAPLVHLMPQATLAVIVIVPCVGMIKIREFRAIWHTRAMEFSWAVASIAGVVLLGHTARHSRGRGFVYVSAQLSRQSTPGFRFGEKAGHGCLSSPDEGTSRR